MKFSSVLGKRFGLLIVTDEEEAGSQRHVTAICDCGNECHPKVADLRSGNTTSCGCRRRSKQGLTVTPEGKAWSSMLRRCSDPSCHNYHRYGGRGITVCERWSGDRGLLNFVEVMGCRPTSGHTLERKNTDGDYEPANCCWASRKEQCNNRSTNRLITAFGETKTLTEWSELTGVKRGTIAHRLNRGNEPESALLLPIRKGE